VAVFAAVVLVPVRLRQPGTDKGADKARSKAAGLV